MLKEKTATVNIAELLRFSNSEGMKITTANRGDNKAIISIQEIGTVYSETSYGIKNSFDIVFDTVEELEKSVEENKEIVLEGETLLHAIEMLSKDMEFTLGVIDGEFVAFNSDKNLYLKLCCTSDHGIEKFMTTKVGDTTTFGEFHDEIRKALEDWEDDYYSKDTSYEAYYGIKSEESCSCRGGGCFYCEPSRFL